MKRWSVAVMRLLRERGMSQVALADASGLSQSQMSRLLAGKGYPSLRALERMADALRVELVELFLTEEEVRAIRQHSPWEEAKRQLLLDQIAALVQQAKDSAEDAPLRATGKAAR